MNRMDYAILLHFDTRTEERLKDAMERLVAAGINSTYRDLQMRPHLTIAEFSAPDIAPVHRQLALTARKWQSFPITLASIGLFPSQPGVLFYAPIVGETLLTVHRELNHALAPLCGLFSPLYQEENWVAHCTVALELSMAEMQKGIAVLADEFAPINARFSEMTVIACCPFRGIASFPLV